MDEELYRDEEVVADASVSESENKENTADTSNTTNSVYSSNVNSVTYSKPASTEYVFSSSQAPYTAPSAREQKQAAKIALAAAKRAAKNEKKARKEQKKAERKPASTGKRIATSIVCGILFGGFAAATLMIATKIADFSFGFDNSNKESQAVVTEHHSSSTNSGNLNAEIQKAPVIEVVGEKTAIPEIVSQVMPAMVSVYNNYSYTYNYNNPFGMYGFGFNFGGKEITQEETATGTGIIIGRTDEELLVVTNNHVVDKADSLEVELINGTLVGANLKGTNVDMDLAVIAISINDLDAETLDAINIANLGSSDELALGEQVVAIGNALGYGQSVTVGYVSALNREITNEDGNSFPCIQTDAAINEGNSGGALLNMRGEVIGINCAKIASAKVEGMGYAIPISNAQDIISYLGERTTKKDKVAAENAGYIGISLQEVTADISAKYGIPVGIFVDAVTEGSGAEAAGLRKGDVITYFDGEKINSYNELTNLLQYYSAGTTVEIKFMRSDNGEYVEHTVDLTLGRKK